MQALASARSTGASARPIGDGGDRRLLRWSARAPTTATPTRRADADAATAAPSPSNHHHRHRPRIAAAAADPSGGGATSSNNTNQTTKDHLFTCRRCLKRVSAADNHRGACRYHPSLYSGGEVAKAIGFVRASADPEDQLERVVGRKGLMRFWDCCGSEDAEAAGCVTGFHLSFDDEDNERRGWK